MIREARSLKDKRQVVQSIKDRLRNAFGEDSALAVLDGGRLFRADAGGGLEEITVVTPCDIDAARHPRPE